jgi:hypothetical protein
MTSNWGDGYVTDIDYEHGYYREQSPTHLRLAATLCSVETSVPAEGAHYLELGCGQGIGALVTAASNPSWRVTGIDFHPGHVASARAIAHAAGIENVTFIEADLSEFAETRQGDALPEANIVSLHGVWSWVSPQVRAGILRLLKAKLVAGGIAHVSYNALPGWQPMLGLQRVLREAGIRIGGRSDRQAVAGLGLVRDLAAAEATTLTTDQQVGRWLEQLGAMTPAYLAHEFMNAHWQPCWHGEVAAAMAEARLDWVGHAALVENFPELTMSGPQRAIYERFEDTAMRELLKDMCSNRTLRHDVYVRGARRLSPAARDARLRETTLALAVPAARVVLEVAVAAGKAELSRDFYGPVVEMLARGPARVADLLHAPGAVASRENPAELTGLLVGTRQAVAVARPGAPMGDAARRLNAQLMERFAVTENLNRGTVLASATLGSGLPCNTPDIFAVGRAMAGDDGADLAGWTATLGSGLDEENQRRLAEMLERARDQFVPHARTIGLLPA